MGVRKDEGTKGNEHGEGFIAKIFAHFDADKSGAIDFHEFQEVLRYINVNISKDKAIKIFITCDADGSKEITFDEFEKGFGLLAKEIATTALGELGLSNVQIYSAVGAGGVTAAQDSKADGDESDPNIMDYLSEKV